MRKLSVLLAVFSVWAGLTAVALLLGYEIDRMAFDYHQARCSRTASLATCSTPAKSRIEEL